MAQLSTLGGMSESLTTSTRQPRFTEDEQKRYREIFAPTAQKYRAGSRLFLIIFGIGATFILAGMFLPKIYFGWFMGAFFICWLVMMIVAITRSSLECPACHGDLCSRELDSYCPECGAIGLKPGGWFQSPYCDSCGKSLRQGKGRNYKIRACTHCGLRLDDRGL